jgi:hypothetical protein
VRRLRCRKLTAVASTMRAARDEGDGQGFHDGRGEFAAGSRWLVSALKTVPRAITTKVLVVEALD